MKRGNREVTREASARILHVAAQERMRAADWKGAVKRLHRAIRLDPFNQALIETLEALCGRFGWEAEFTHGLIEAHTGGNRHSDTLANLIAVSIAHGLFEGALAFLIEFRELFPSHKRIGPWRVSRLEQELLSSLRGPWGGRRARRGWAPPMSLEPAAALPPRSPAPSSARATLPLSSSEARHSLPGSRRRSRQAELFRTAPTVRAGDSTASAPTTATATAPIPSQRDARRSLAAPPKTDKHPTLAPASPGLEHEVPLLDRMTLARIPVETEVEEASFLHILDPAQADADGARRHALCIMANRLAMVNSIDELLCLPTLRGVQEFWYQVETVRKVLRQFRGRALLCDEVGLGKTIEAGMVIKEYLLRGVVRSVLVLVPPALVSQWEEEFATKFGLTFATTADPLRRRDPDLFWHRARLCIASLTLAKSRRNFARVAATEFDLVVVDEAHHLKNRDTKAWKLINAMKSRFLLLLTATPIHNSLIELHNIITLLKPGQLKTRSAFMQEFVSGSDPTAPVNERKLRELLSEVMVRNTRALAGIKLPARRATTICVEPRADERVLYERLASMVRTEYRGRGDGHGQGLDRMTLRLLQCEAGSSARALLRTLEKVGASRPPGDPLRAEVEEAAGLARAIDGSAKLQVLKPLLAKGREQIIVFAGFRGTLDFLAERLTADGIGTVAFHGGLTAAEKDGAIEAFRRGVPVLLTTEVGGEGRNLQFCHRLVNFDLPWNPMRIEQRIGRIHRIGQEKETEVWNVCARGSVEDHLLEILDRKINMFELVIGEVDMILGQMEDGRDFSERVLEAWASAETEEEVGANFERLSAELGKAKVAYERVRRLDTALFGEDYEV